MRQGARIQHIQQRKALTNLLGRRSAMLVAIVCCRPHASLKRCLESRSPVVYTNAAACLSLRMPPLAAHGSQ